MIVVTLELTSFGTDEIGSVRKIEQPTPAPPLPPPAADGSTPPQQQHRHLRLIVTLPRKIDEEQANLTAALLFQNLDRLPGTAIIERVKISGLHFTSTSVIGIQGFLSAHAATVKHVSIKDMMCGTGSSSGSGDVGGGGGGGDDEQQQQRDDAEVAFCTLARVFEVSSSLETLNLSDNVIGASVWQHWAVHRHLRQLILDYVEISDGSLAEFARHFTFGDSLEELYVVLTNSTSRAGQAAANQVLRKCRRLSSLRWAEKDAPATALLPWNGLMELARNHFNNNGVRNSNGNNGNGCASLVHLVMDGGSIKEEELGEDGLCGAIRFFQRLRTLKLRSIGLGDEGAELLANALAQARPPLETLDLSKNSIKSIGSMAIAKLSADETITRNLVLVAIEHNAIDTGGARTILERFAKNPNTRLEIKLDGNPFNYGKLAFNLARRKAQADTEREDMRYACEATQQRTGAQRPATDSQQQLQEEVQKLREEKASLLHVLAIVSSANATNEVERALDRISNLERRVLGSVSNGGGDSASRGTTSSSSAVSAKPPAPDNNSLGRLLSRARSSRDLDRGANNDTTGSIASASHSSPTKKSSPRLGAAHGTPSPTVRRSSIVNTPTIPQQSLIPHTPTRNTLIRGISEKWGSPMNGGKKKASAALLPQSTSPSPIGSSKYMGKLTAYMPYHSAVKIDLDGTNRTNHSNNSASSTNQRSWENSG
jgi:hypothetical protein